MAPQYENVKGVKISEQKWLNGLQMVQLECPRHWKPSVTFSFGVGRIPFSHYWPFGVIRIGLPVWRWKCWKIIWTKVAQRTPNGPVWKSKALKSTCMIHFWSWNNSFYLLLALWGNKNGLPSMKIKKVENFENKIGSKHCKWSSLNAQSTEIHVSHPILKLGVFPFLKIGPLG